jgi:hypothetical protein
VNEDRRPSPQRRQRGHTPILTRPKQRRDLLYGRLAFAAASNSHGTVAVAINASIWYVKAGLSGTLFANAREVSLNPKLATYSIEVTDDAGEIIAVFEGMVYRKKQTISPEIV